MSELSCEALFTSKYSEYYVKVQPENSSVRNVEEAFTKQWILIGCIPSNGKEHSAYGHTHLHRICKLIVFGRKLA